MNGMALKRRNKQINPNLAHSDKQTCEQRRRNSKAYKKIKTEAYQVKQTKQKKWENQNQGFWVRVYVRVHRLANAGQLYAYAYFELACAYKSMRTQTYLSPNPENRQAEKQSKT